MKMPSKLIASILTGALALGLVGCGNANTTHKSASNNEPKTAQEAKGHKSNKKSVKKTLSKPNPQKQINQNKQNNTRNKQIKSNRAKLTTNRAKLTKTEKKSLNSEPSSRPVVDLGDGVKGIVDRGAGQVYISFRINGHNIIVHGNDVQNDDNALDKAREIVAHKSEITKSQQIQANGTK